MFLWFVFYLRVWSFGFFFFIWSFIFLGLFIWFGFLKYGSRRVIGFCECYVFFFRLSVFLDLKFYEFEFMGLYKL